MNDRGSTPKGKITAAQKNLGLRFDNLELIEEALTHRSYAFETGSKRFNERLEFLGDCVLNLIVTDFIFYRWPSYAEGDLAKLRANLVNADVLAEVANRLDLGDCILMGKGAEQTGGRVRTSVLSDCLEAIIGAVYLDKGMDAAREFVLRNLEDIIFEAAATPDLTDAKSRLQEYTMEKLQILPEYKVAREEGPVHQKIFVIEVSVSGKTYARGRGSSKKRAEQSAAAKAYKKLKGELEKRCT